VGVRRAAIVVAFAVAGTALITAGAPAAGSSSPIVAVVTRDVLAPPSAACDGSDPIHASQIFGITADGAAKPITSYHDEPAYESDCQAGYAQVAVSPDGSRVAATEATGGGESGLALMDLDGANLQRPGVGATFVAWSPDSEKLAVLDTHVDAPGDVTIANADGTVDYTFALSTLARGIVWLPDGSGVAVLESNSDGISVFANYPIADTAPTEPSSVKPFEAGTTLRWVSNNLAGGRFVGITTAGFVTDSLGDPGGPVGIDVQGLPAQRNLALAGPQAIFPTWLPDGDSFAFTYSTDGVFTAPASGGTVSRPYGEDNTGDITISFPPASAAVRPSLSPSVNTTLPPRRVVEPPAPPQHPRSLVLAGLRAPGDISWSPAAVLGSLLLALIGLLIVFPAELFNGTFEEHYDEIVGWFRRERDPDAPRRRGPPGRAVLLGVVVVIAALTALLDPDARFDSATTAQVVGVAVAILVVIIVGDIPARLFHRRSGLATKFRGYPAAILVAGACVAISRAAHFQPGYIYGVAGGLVVTGEQSKPHDGKAAVLETLGAGCLAFAGWFAWTPITHHIAGRPHPSFGLLMADALIGLLWLDAACSIAVSLLPLHFLTGRRILLWSKPAWVASFGAAMFVFVHMLLRPDAGYTGSIVTMVSLFAGFCFVSVAFWWYFRLRPEPADATEPGD
jgi:hypothetical protein